MKLERSKLADVEVIRGYYKGDVLELTEHQETVKECLLQVQSLLAKRTPTTQIINTIKDIYKVSDSQAYRYLRGATSLYGDLRKAEKEGIRWLLYDQIMEDYNDAKEKGDMKAMAAFQKNIITIMGLDRESQDMPEFENIQPPPIVMVFNKNIELKIEESSKKGVVDLTELFLNNIEDATIDDTRTDKKQDK